MFYFRASDFLKNQPSVLPAACQLGVLFAAFQQVGGQRALHPLLDQPAQLPGTAATLPSRIIRVQKVPESSPNFRMSTKT